MTDVSGVAKDQCEYLMDCFSIISTRLGKIRKELSNIDKREKELSVDKKECEADQDRLAINTFEAALLKEKNQLLFEQKKLEKRQSDLRVSLDSLEMLVVSI